MATSSNNKSTEGAKTLYDRLTTDRDAYTQRAENNATYTIPQLFPKESDDGGTQYDTPYQSVGARGINNLASKLLLSLLPPNQPFFRLGLDEQSQQALEASNDEETRDAIEYGLSKIEQAMMRYMEQQKLRPTMFEALKQLIIAGNALLFFPPAEGGVRCYSLRNYVVQRDGTGNVIQLVARDTVARSTLGEDLRNAVPDATDETNALSEKVEVYTHVYRSEDGQSWESYQEIEGEHVAGTEQTYPLNKCPWIPLRFYKKDGEHYGRSFVEDYIGDLISLNNLWESTINLSMVAAKVVFLVSPSCQTNIRQLAKCDTGAFVKGRPEDVTVVQTNKSGDAQTVQAAMAALEQRLSLAFLLNTAVQRDGERVTAEEIRYMAQELESTLGGVYSLLSQEMQIPIVACVFNQMQSKNLLPSTEQIDVNIEPQITSGLDALGRGADFQKLTQVLQVMQNFEEFMATLNVGNLARKLFTSVGVSYEGLVKTQEQLAEEQQAAMQQQQQLMAMQGATDATVAQANKQGQ